MTEPDLSALPNNFLWESLVDFLQAIIDEYGVNDHVWLVRCATENLAALRAWRGPQPEETREGSPQDGLLHPAHQVFFRAGLIACREYMARFVEAESLSIAQSIRANWWPSLGADFGPPRKLAWDEVTTGEFGTESFKPLSADQVSPTQEALPIALAFLEGDTAKSSVPLPAPPQEGREP